ncbi:MAG TPA: hypothetical protein PLP73_01890 [Candidatus Absconditabacterales bacterium]|nr:hypothetical protein [Candidatus Absconditabacterales bacterium]
MKAIKKEYDFFIDECVEFFKHRPHIVAEFGETEITAEGVERYLKGVDFSGDMEHTLREAGYIKGLDDAMQIANKQNKQLEKLLKAIEIAYPTTANMKYIYNAISKILN